MKRLFLFRHARAVRGRRWSDFERPLSPRGIWAAEAMAEHSRNRLRRVDVALCSTAIRTHETLRLLERSLPPSCKTALDDAFYLADWRVLLSALHGLDDRCNVALLVGHDPGLSKLARCLCPERGSPKALRRIRKGLKPGSLAAINLPIDHWRDLSPGVGRLRAVIKPKDLR